MNIFATTPLSPSALVPSKGDRNVTWPLQIMPFLKVITVLKGKNQIKFIEIDGYT